MLTNLNCFDLGTSLKKLCLSQGSYAHELCQKGDIFPKKRMEAIFVYILEYMLTIVSLDKMQNISTFKHKSSKSEGRAF